MEIESGGMIMAWQEKREAEIQLLCFKFRAGGVLSHRFLNLCDRCCVFSVWPFELGVHGKAAITGNVFAAGSTVKETDRSRFNK